MSLNQFLALPYMKSDDCYILWQESVDFVKETHAHFVDCILTDPPYELSIGGKSWDAPGLPIDWWAYQFGRVTKPTGSVFVFCSDFQFGTWYMELSKWFTNITKFAWVKTNPVQGKFKKLGCFAESVELAVHAYNSQSYFNREDIFLNHYTSGICSGNERLKADGVVHPTQKPEALIKYIMEGIAKPKDIILDPFGGTYTTVRVAKKIGRCCIGIDQDPYIGVQREKLMDDGWKIMDWDEEQECEVEVSTE